MGLEPLKEFFRSVFHRYRAVQMNFRNISPDMAPTLILLSIFIAEISCFNIESHFDIWCEEPIKTVDLQSINFKTDLNFNKKLIQSCGISLKHIPNKNWTSELTQNFRELFKPKLKVLKISDGLRTLHQSLFSLESKLRYLDLSGNVLNHLELPEFKYELPVVHQNIFHHLYTLDLSKNKFTNISFIQTKIPNLKEVDLSQNNLKEVPLGTLPLFLDLEKLILRHNNITKFENSLEHSRIEYLDVSNNHLRNLSGAEKLTNLHTLIVSNNNLQNLNTNFFKDVVWGLNDLYLDNNNIIEVAEDTFRFLPDLKTLKLNNNLITKLGQGVFSVLKKLESLDISHNFIFSLEADSFLNQNRLIELNLRNNFLEILDYEGIVHLLPSLKEMDVLENHFRCDVFEKMLQFFTKNSIIVPGGEICLGRLNDECCSMELTTIIPQHSTERDSTVRMTERVDSSRLTNHLISYDISKFFSLLEKKTDSLLKLFVYQLAFMISVIFLALFLYIRRNYTKSNFNLKGKQQELEKIISS